jgi:hypothetical protein
MITDINLTLVVQMINFIIAYIIIRILLLKPAVEAINQEEEARAYNQKIINNTTQTNEAKEDTMRRRWIYCQQECLQLVPSPGDVQEELKTKEGTTTFQAPPVSTQYKEKITKDIADELIQRMSHVR